MIKRSSIICLSLIICFHGFNGKSQPSPLTVTGVVTHCICNGTPTGSIDITASGGVGMYHYLWDPWSTDEDLYNLPAGTYTVIVTDDNGSSVSGTWYVLEPDQLAVTATVTPATCCPGNNGSISLLVTGGTPMYSYLWSNNSISQNINGLECGTYSVTVFDANFCAVTANWTVTPELDVIITPDSPPKCCGKINLTPSYGTQPYTYLWLDDNSTDKDRIGLCAGNYCVIVTDFYNSVRSCCWDVPAQKSTCQSNYLQNITIIGGENICYDASQTLYVAGSGTTFIIQNGGLATMIAGSRISYKPGTKVYPGGRLHGYITTNGQFCNKSNGGDAGAASGTGSDSIAKWNSAENRVFSIYPNPTTGRFILDLSGDDFSSVSNLEIYAMHGEKILTAELKGAGKHEFSLADKQPGLYFIRVITANNSGTAKIIRQ